MPDDLIERLFSLFTSSDRAEAMAGDLIQERRDRGSTWFWWHVFVTAATLWATAAFRAPLRTLALVTVGCALVAAPALAGVAAVGLFLASSTSLPRAQPFHCSPAARSRMHG